MAAAQPPPTTPVPSAASLRERDAAADRAIDARKSRIAAAKDGDPGLAALLIDQAGALLARPGRDGSDSAVLFGIPLPAQINAVRADAAEAAALLKRAKQLTDADYRALTDAQTPENDPRFDQLNQDRSIRVPFYRGRAEALLATMENPSFPHAQLAVDSLAKLALASTAPESLRRVTFAAGLLRRHNAGDAQLALEELAAVATADAAPANSPEAIPAQTRAEAWFGLLHASGLLGTADQALPRLHAALGKPPFASPAGVPDPLYSVLAADAASASLTAQAIRTNHPALLDLAIAEQSALLARTDLGFSPAAMRPLVFEKLALLAGSVEGAKIQVPAGMRLAQAIIASRNPAKRDDALAKFEAIARDPASGDFAPDALWEQAVLQTQPGRATPDTRLHAAQALTRLAREFPKSPRAQESIKAALAYARALEAETTPAPEPVRTAYLAALSLAATQYDTLPDIDLWRYELARVSTSSFPSPAGGGVGGGGGGAKATPEGEGSTAAATAASTARLRTLTLALDQLSKVPPTSTVAENARSLHDVLRVQQLDALWSQFTQTRRTDEAQARALARAALRPAADQAVAFATAHRSPFVDRFRADQADALVESGASGSRPIYESLLASPAPLPGGRPRLQLGLARALLLSGDKAGAFPLLHDAAAALDAAPTSPPAGEVAAPAAGEGSKGIRSIRPEMFWHAWTLTLELLADENKDGARTSAILAHVKRLELLDPTLGGPPWASRITAAKSRAKQ